MAGTISVSSRSSDVIGKGSSRKCVEKVVIDWVADAAAATVPDLVLELQGFIIKAITNPGATAPTDNYDITLGGPEDSALDVLGGALLNRDTANTEQVYPLITGAVIPVFVSGSHTLSIANNAVNSASGRIVLYLVDSL